MQLKNQFLRRHGWKKLLVPYATLTSDITSRTKLDSRNRIRDYAYFAKSGLLAKKNIVQTFFLKKASKLIVVIFFRASSNFLGQVDT